VRDMKLIAGPSGPFVAMPSRKLCAHCRECGHKNPFKRAEGRTPSSSTSVPTCQVGRVETDARTHPTLPTGVCPGGNWVHGGPVGSSSSGHWRRPRRSAWRTLV
jgi:hypothetical protein